MTTILSRHGIAPDAARVWLLGGFRMSVGHREVDESVWRLRKAASLLKLLALAPPQALLEKLKDRLKLLRGGPREFSERQRT